MKETKEIIKGAFSYSGNKYRIYNSYLSEIMNTFDKIHEPFIGSGVCIYNSNIGGIGIDQDKNVVALHNSLNDVNLLDKIKTTYAFYFKNGRDKQSYMNLRNDFNKSYIVNGTTSDNVHMLHLLIQLSFNSLMRFSKNGYNVPFGMKEVDFNRIVLHQKLVQNKDINVIHGSYSDLNLTSIDKNKDLIYLDPPYIASKFQYGGWNKEDELLLLDYINQLDDNGYKFILSNTFNHRGLVNQDLIDWSQRYTVKYINMSYNAWSASVSSVEVEKNTKEVLISNFIF